ncbi:hypothetical protein [Propylenella binzhouense]|uniref:DUF4198 domain-containing protein n=1 Tax=Propylenella binzhouense TaxID=2555902 RepID=A0A964T289_9HYPH|nr:hypothetical protein [Propylenella binzhouense]MYZ47141.1 hypothetical protein [Propylenella binzhouense]
MLSRFLAHVLVAATVLASGGASAEEAVVPLAAPDAGFVERLGGAKISAQFVVGARLGHHAKPFAPEQVAAYLGDRSIGDSLCARVTTRDGRYWALNRYDASRVSAGSARLAFPSHHLDALRAYEGEDVLVRASLVKDCEAGEPGVLLPARGDASPEGPRTLFVYLNVGDMRARAKLSGTDGAALAATACEPTRDGIAVSYTRICAIELPAAIGPGLYTLALERRGLVGKAAVDTLRIWLP